MINTILIIWDFFKSQLSVIAPTGVGVGIGVTINHISVGFSILAIMVGLILSIINYTLKRDNMRLDRDIKIEELKKLKRNNENSGSE